MIDRTKVGTCAHGDSSLVRPHFSEGLLLQDDDLTAGVTYTRALSRLMFRTLFGCGVLCGLRVSPPRLECGVMKIDVAGGVGLSCLGDPVEVIKSQTVAVDTCKVEVGQELWIAMRGTEKCCAPRTAICGDEDNPSPSCTRERDGFEICAFSSRPECSCGCAPLAPPPPPDDGEQPDVILSELPSTTMPAEEPALDPDEPCHCNKRTGVNACYGKFYRGECPCGCCECEWIILAVAKREGDTDNWKVDHSVRRFVRPVLMRDWVVEQERANPGA
jgi:hypothetical protein